MARPDITEAERKAVQEVLNTPHLSMGPKIEEFESAFASYAGTRHAVAVSSGTAGLHLALIAAGVEAGDMVVTTPFSFVASANVILYQRAMPVFVDVDRNTGNIDPGKVDEVVGRLQAAGPKGRLTGMRKGSQPAGSLKAILPVHAFGQPAPLDRLASTANRNRVALIEDACEALGAEYRCRRIPSGSDAAVFAFYPNKQITTGEGGMITTNRRNWDALFRSLRNQGRDLFNAWLRHARLGYNYRLNEMSAALGLAQLGRIEKLLADRRRVAGWYDERLEGHDWIETPPIAAETTSMSWFVYVVRIRPPLSRDDVMEAMAVSGIPSRPYFSPIHLQPYYRELFGFRRGDFPVAECLGDVSLALPFFGAMSEDQVDAVCACLKRCAEGLAAKSRPETSAR